MIRRIRHATPSDAEAILGIYAPYINETSISFETKVPTIAEFATRMENLIKNYPYLACEVNGKIIGYAYGSRHRERDA